MPQLEMEIKKSDRTKIGLALSGGGFRASLFHIGVLASLAESGILKNVEVMSCVSGGSIIGAYYHLHLKELLETKADKDICDRDYLNIMEIIQKDFLITIQKNIRVRAFSNILDNCKMILEKYSRSDRMAELYDKMLFGKFKKGTKNTNEPLLMTDLFITPKGYTGNGKFNLRENNKRREHKIPMIIINATTLNTGRNWQFTAVNMGEQESNDKEYNKNNLLKAINYEDNVLNHEEMVKYKKVPLSVAVAASACVPGLFSPLALTDLYPEVTPMLVDGGVYDNQGISAINYEGCTDVIISDASGEMDFVPRPGGSLFNVLSRTNSVLMDRIRNLGMSISCIQKQADKIDNLTIIHLKKGLEVEYLVPGKKKFSSSKAIQTKTDYGVAKNIQDKLAHIRTDLDAFTDLEAYSLMYSGYKMTGKLTEQAPFRKGYNKSLNEHNWNFCIVENYLKGDLNNKNYNKQLKFSKFKLFKAYLLMPYLMPIGLLNFIVSLIPIYVVYLLVPSQYFINSNFIVLSLIIFIIISVKVIGIKYIKNSLIIKVVNTILTLLLAPFLSVLSTLYLLLINNLYVAKGKIKQQTLS